MRIGLGIAWSDPAPGRAIAPAGEQGVLVGDGDVLGRDGPGEGKVRVVPDDAACGLAVPEIGELVDYPVPSSRL